MRERCSARWHRPPSGWRARCSRSPLPRFRWRPGRWGRGCRRLTRDRGNQLTLGAFLGTFSYALMVLRSVRTQSEGDFVPHLSLTFGILLAFVCVGTLVYFVGHMASRINVDTVIELVSEDVRLAIERLTTDEKQPAPPWRLSGATRWRWPIPSAVICSSSTKAASPIGRPSAGRPFGCWYARATMCFPARRSRWRHLRGRSETAIASATALGPQRVSSVDLEFAVRQLVEVAVRALSPASTTRIPR